MRIPRVLLAAALVGGLSGCVGAAAAISPSATETPVGHAEFQLMGGWVGTADDDGNGVTDMAVDSAADDGTAFDGRLTFTIAGSSTTEAVSAAMTPRGHLVAEIGADASIELHIVDPSTLDYCFSRYGADFVYSCGTLTRTE